MSADAEIELGVRLAAEGRHDEAIAAYDRALALNPHSPEAWSNRGNSLLLSGRIDAALESHTRALTENPDYGAAWFNRAHGLLLLERWEEAVAHYDRGFALLGEQPAQLVNRGNALLALGRTEAALDSFCRAVAVMPQLAEAQNGMAAALKTLGRFEEAMAASDAVMALRPEWAEGLGTRGAILHALARFPEALACQDRALALQPGNPVLHFNRGLALHDLRDPAGLDAYATAAALRPDYADAHWNRALFQLALHDFDGWAGYEWGWQAGHRGTPRPFGPAWLGGGDLAGKTLLLHAEQGLGDTLQFVRYARMAAARGARVVLEVQTPLVRLLRRLPYVSRVLAGGEMLPAFDLHCPMLSLPLAFGTRFETIPADMPYLVAKPADWGVRLAGLPRPLVGLVWAGASRPHQPEAHRTDQRRSLHVSRMAPFGLTGATFVSLQKGEPGAEPKPFPMVDFTDDLQDFADTADLVAHLDLVISVDTSTAHLAAALGKPVWLLSRHDSCWRWGYARGDTPWYPSMRIFRQPSRGDWETVVTEVAQALSKQFFCEQKNQKTFQ